jgi:hypothetical protein
MLTQSIPPPSDDPRDKDSDDDIPDTPPTEPPPIPMRDPHPDSTPVGPYISSLRSAVLYALARDTPNGNGHNPCSQPVRRI